MKEIYERIRDLAAPYQDKRDDDGHARITLAYAHRLLEMEGGDENIVIPAIILHDIGWSRVLASETAIIFDPATTPQQEYGVRRSHQDEGVRLAGDLLAEIDYPGQLTDDILEIISEHDTRQGFISRNEGLVRDADKLWRFSRTGLAADVRRFGITREAQAARLEAQLDRPDFFYSEAARRLAREELARRRAEA